MKVAQILRLSRDDISDSQAVIAANAIDAGKRVDAEIAKRMAANDAKAQAERSNVRRTMREMRDRRRDRGDALMALWADWRAWEAQGLGYPPENMLAKMMKRRDDPAAGKTASDRGRNDDDGEPMHFVLMTLVERQAQAYGMFMQLDNLVNDPAFPIAYRTAIKLVYGQQWKQDRAAVEMGISQAELSICLGMAREHVAHQYDDMRLRWT